jgi:hypothetical protein
MTSYLGHVTTTSQEGSAMMTATQAYKTLGISRNTFYLRVKDLKIELVKEGRNSMIQPEDLQRIKEALGTRRQNASSVIGRHSRTSQQGQVGQPDDTQTALIDELRSQNTYLKGQIDVEKETNTKLLEQMQQGQQLMMAMQTETLRLRQENQKLLLGHTTTDDAKGSSRDIEGLTEVSAVSTQQQPRSNWAWSGFMLAAMGVLGWVLYQVPSLEFLSMTGW